MNNNMDNTFKQLCDYIKSLETENAELKARVNGEEPSEKESYDSSAFDCLAVTQVQAFPFKDGLSLGHLKGLAHIVLNDQIVIRGLRVMEGVNGLFVSYPLDPFYKGDNFKPIVNPITRQLREHIENCVLEKYQAAIA